LDVARLHSGDLSIWSAMGEQIRELDARGIAYDVTPGVPAFAAAAACLGRELTVPALAQTVVLTRTSGRASPMPEGETLAAYAATGAT
ncbi:precorrin-4 C(11)-methyltransferase, partial [Mycobacterium tuberculosis]|nr:precorrin-4 C(11)-methyltransferase [Mycobacterium tuberculosis]